MRSFTAQAIALPAGAGSRGATLRRFTLRPLVLALMMIGRLGGTQAQNVLPSGLAVVQGRVTTEATRTGLTVTNSANALLNWESFSVGSGNSVRFNQPSSTSQVLNRVVGKDPSNILGSISSNGRVWLLNPNGVLFGQGARINVAGLVASTLNISDADWQAQRLSLRAGGGRDAPVENRGEITSTTGGRVFLIGGPGGVSNEGVINAPGGQIALVAGDSVTLVDRELPNLEIQVKTLQGTTSNVGKGQLLADDGRIDLSAAIVNQNGIVRADSAKGIGGQIELRASESLNTAEGSTTSADGARGGRVTLDGGDGTARLSGQITASSLDPAGKDGFIELGANSVILEPGALLQASATGDAIVIHGPGQSNTSSFVNNAGAQALSAPRGRWLIYATKPTDQDANGNPSFVQGDLDHGATYYGRTADKAPPGGEVNLLLFEARPALSLAGNDTPVSRTYDGSTGVVVSESTHIVGLVNGDGVLGTFNSKDVDAARTIELFPFEGPVSVINASSGKPVFGYLLQLGSGRLNGAVTPKTLSVDGVSALNKVYDGNTTATLAGGALLGVLDTESLTLDLTGRFDTKNAGTAKSVTVTAIVADGAKGARASNYILERAPLITTADITPKAVTVSGVTAADKIYDGNTNATLRGGAVNGLVGNETLVVDATGQFDTRNAGAGKAVTGRAALADGANGGLAGNYALADAGVSTRADVTPRGVGVATAVAANKTYDGTTAAQVTAWTLAGVLNNDQVSVASGSGTFADSNAGVAKGVTASATALGGGDAGNYALAQASTKTVAAISPATLTYVATPAARVSGEALSGFSGTVTGFVGAESVQTATTGSLQFNTPASPASPVGRYALNGSGLSSGNYTFNQAPANAAALVITPRAGVTQPTLDVPPVRPQRATVPRTDARTLNVLPGMRIQADGGSVFESLDVAGMSQDALGNVLEARNRYKQSLLAEARRQLEADPGLADAPACLTVKQVDTGACLVTEELKVAIREAAELAVATAAGVKKPVLAPQVSAALPNKAPPAKGIAPKPAAPSTAAALASTAVAGVPTDLLLGRIIRRAGVPQIQRKVAVVIGIDNYTDVRIPTLQGARVDAEAVANVLSGTLGYETALVIDGTREAILRRLNRLVTQVGPNDSVVIYYAGHGDLVEKTGLGYWLPANADAMRPQTWISNNDIGKVLSRISASQVVLISDSCFSGSLLSDERMRIDGQVADADALLKRRAALVMSSGGNEPVADTGKNGHSVFAWNLMRTLEQVTTWRPGANVFEQVRIAVARELPQRPRYGAARASGHEQGGDYVFEQRQFEGTPPQ